MIIKIRSNKMKRNYNSNILSDAKLMLTLIMLILMFITVVNIEAYFLCSFWCNFCTAFVPYFGVKNKFL